MDPQTGLPLTGSPLREPLPAAPLEAPAALPEEPLAPGRRVYSVSQLNREARALLEEGFPLPVWVEGELSNLARPSSGHLYFTLKDEGAQVRCAMFRGRNRHLAFRPENGMQVLALGRIGLYEPRGDFQLVVEELEEAGEGHLRRELERLKRRLAAEGLFDASLKRPLPPFPRRIGVVTSPTGAALRDVLSVLRRRWALARVLVYPVPVQGAAAAPAIAEALALASARADCQVLILTRGGGSLEDLWAFNEEAVVRAIRACALPVVSAVGHEIDWTLADLAADRRAPTPSAAAELVSPDAAELLGLLQARLGHLAQAAGRRLALAGERHRAARRRLLVQHPGRRLQRGAQRLDELELRLGRAA
ncbi:MAG: exodeoxyribonuclease VII large subunit, partial [Gammaproteobacteria bacterium]